MNQFDDLRSQNPGRPLRLSSDENQENAEDANLAIYWLLNNISFP